MEVAMTPAPCLSTSAVIISPMIRLFSLSRWLIGSSRKRKSNGWQSARIKATRCCCPKDSLPTFTLIYKAKDGIFYSYIYLKKDNEIIRIDARTSDAIALAVRADCPILIYESILEQECLHLSGEERTRSGQINDEGISDEEALQQAIKEENYELAARIRDQINSRNNNQ